MTPSRPYTVSSAMPAAVCGKTIGRSMMPSMARLPTKSRRASRYASGTPTTKPIAVAISAADIVSHSERRMSSWRRASPRRPAPAPTIMLAAGSTTKATSSAPATAQAAQNSEGRRPLHHGSRGRRAGGPGSAGCLYSLRTLTLTPRTPASPPPARRRRGRARAAEHRLPSPLRGSGARRPSIRKATNSVGQPRIRRIGRDVNA